MLLALVCLWVGFAFGFVCAALMRASSRDTAPLDHRPRRTASVAINRSLARARPIAGTGKATPSMSRRTSTRGDRIRVPETSGPP